ncbi:MAG TPA: recombinase RecT [Candidatus Saccharibacteria bacterium]|nr:recombinase RecT [Candidatus Saccharibacteria bacterium]
MSNQIQVIESLIQQCEPKFNQVSAFSESTQNAFNRESQFAMQIIGANDFLAKTAVNNQSSLINAVVNVAAIGISLNPAEKEAYLVPRNGAVCLDISYVGLMRLATDTGQIAWVQSDIVYEKDHFRMVGLDKQPEHHFNAFDKSRGEAVGVYVTAKLASGDYLTDTMTTEEINAIRDKSQGHIAFMSKKARSSIWNDHWGEMAKKTVVKRASKYWPKSERLDQAIYHLNTDAGEGIAPNIEPVNHAQEWLDKLLNIDNIDTLREESRKAPKSIFAQIKDQVTAHAEKLKTVIDSEVVSDA